MRGYHFIANLLSGLLFSVAALFLSAVSCAAHSRLDIDIGSIREHVVLTEAEKNWLAEEPEIRVRVGRWPPFMMTEGHIEGISIDYLDIIAEVCGLKFTYLTNHDISWPETLSEIAARGKVDMVPAIQATPERRSFMDFTTPYQVLPWVIVTRKDAPFVGDLNDLNGREISVQRGFIMEERLESLYPNLNLTTVDTPFPTLDSLKLVATGTAFATINALPTVEYFIRRDGLTNLKVAAPAGLPDMELSMGIRKDMPELTSVINKVFRAMSRKDKAVVQNDWMSVKYEYGIAHSTVLMIALATLSGIFIIVALFMVINRTLKRQVDERTADLQKELIERARIEKALKESLNETEVLLREVHHRVKNNLQIISGLLFLQETSPDQGDTAEVLRECRNRVQSIALVHKKLYQSKSMSDVRLDEYIQTLTEQLTSTLSMEQVELDIDAQDVKLTIEQAIPCGLIINELITNSLKHAFTEKSGNRISVAVRGADNEVTLEVSDNGKGMDPDLDIRNSSSLGLILVENLSVQLGGKLTITRSPGTTFTLVFPMT